LQNDKQEWVLPKGVIRAGQGAYEVAINRVREEAGVEAEIIGPAGETSYEFYSYSRKQPVCNKITWFIMGAKSEHHRINRELGLSDVGFNDVAEDIDKITYSQDKSLVRVSYQRLKKLTSVEKLA